MDPYLHSPYLLMLYSRKTLHLQNKNIFHTEFHSVGRERVVFSDEAESCIVGSRVSGITSPTSEALFVDLTACRQVSLLRLSMSDRAQDDRQSVVFLSHIHIQLPGSTGLWSRKN